MISTLTNCFDAVIKQLKNFTEPSGDDNNKMAIIVTIHQPSFRLLTFFDHVYVLSVNGTCIYSGPVMNNALKDHLISRGLDCSDGHNPADVVIEAASISTSMFEGENENKAGDYNIFSDWWTFSTMLVNKMFTCIQCAPCKATIEEDEPMVSAIATRCHSC